MWYLFCRKLSEVGWNYQKPILLGPEIYQPPLLQKISNSAENEQYKYPRLSPKLTFRPK